MFPGRAAGLAATLLATALAGCLGAGNDAPEPLDENAVPAAPYTVVAPDLDLPLLEQAELVNIPGWDVEIHVRIVRPDIEDPVPVIAQFTPYTAPGRGMLVEPLVAPPAGTFVEQFVRRGYAFAFADVRGTGDSGGCLDLRGSLDILDAWHLTEFLGTQPWSSGKVGFIGASYPGSEAHIAGIANNPHLGGVIPVVASTSFYSYHHKNGVPYSNHLATNTGYTQYALMPTKNPQFDNWVVRQVREPVECDTANQLAVQLDQSGAYTPWWADRNLRWRVGEVKVPVLMAQGLADWNVKPDHIARYFNDLNTTRKTLIAGQWGHQYPEDAEGTYGVWWEFAAAFFDETLRGVHTGLFDANRAYVQDTEEVWHVYDGAWPPLEPGFAGFNLTESGLTRSGAPAGTVSWHAVPGFTASQNQGGQYVVLESEPLAHELRVSGTPKLDLTVTSEARDLEPPEVVHLVAVLEVDYGSGWVRENYGYLNPVYREGIDQPKRFIPGESTPVTIEMYPQEDVFPAGAKLRLILRSHDEGRTVAVFDEGIIRVDFAGARPGVLWLPLSPPAA